MYTSVWFYIYIYFFLLKNNNKSAVSEIAEIKEAEFVWKHVLLSERNSIQ